jgi:hypothetical protein
LTANVISLNIPAGIQRDGTIFDSPMFVDGQWCRFQRGRPRKMGGYRGIFLDAPSISRGMVMQSQEGLNYVYSGFNNSLQYWQTDDDDGVGSGPTNISMTGFTASNNNLWQFDVGYDSSGSGSLQLIAHAGQNLVHIDSTVNTKVLTGAFPGGALSPVGVFTLSGSAGTPNAFTIVVNSSSFIVGVGQTVTGSGVPANTVVTAVSVVTTPSPVTTITVNNAISGTSTVTFTFDNNISVSGGACMLYPYLFVYGNNGLIQNCAAGDFNNWVSADSNANNISATKVVKGLPLRGGTTSPAGLFWSLDQLTRVTYAPQTLGTSTLYWRYDIISTQTSILSAQSPIEYDGIYYWCGVDRFLMYNGVVQEIPNNTNINYFFDNLNYTQRQKVWAAKIPRWGEIWWFYPKGNATECTDAIIYNVRDKIWYDAGEAEGARRSAGVYSEVFRFPIWAGNEENVEGTYTLWQHETGVDQIYLNNVNAIESYFETNSIGWVTGGPGQRNVTGANRWIHLERLEPDFVQAQQMFLTVTGKSYAAGENDVSDPYYYDPDTLKIDLREQRREMRLRFTSNIAGGNYEAGNILISADIGDERGTGNP